MANLEAESGLDPNAKGDKNPEGVYTAHGIAQWHAPRPGRSVPGSTFERQLAWVDDELRAQNGATDESHAAFLLAQTDTPELAAEVVCRHYERPADKDGESVKRAALASRIFAEMETSAPEPAPQATPVRPTSTGPDMPVLLASLLPTILGMFTPLAAAKLSQITKLPVDQQTLFLQQIGGQIAQATQVGTPNPATGQLELKTDLQAAQAVAAMQKLKDENSELIGQIEARALDFLDKLAPTFDRLSKEDVRIDAAKIAGANAAAARALTDPYDVAPVMVANVTRTSNWLLAGLVGATILAIVLKAIFVDMPDYVSMILPVLGLLAGQISKERGAIIAYRFDGNPAQNAANAMNQAVVASLPDKR